jgi:hypothetical protein
MSNIEIPIETEEDANIPQAIDCLPDPNFLQNTYSPELYSHSSQLQKELGEEQMRNHDLFNQLS